MKKLIIGLTALMCFSFYAENVEAKRYVQYSMHGGFFGLYRDIDQSFLGRVEGTLDTMWQVNCESPGTKSCKLRGPGGQSGNPFEDPLMEFAKKHISQLEDDIQELVNLGTWIGTKSLKIIRNNPETSETTWVIINAEWTALDKNFNDGTMLITIDEIPYTL